MQRPSRLIDHAALERSASSCRRLVAYLLRATVKRVSRDAVGGDRFRSLSSELADCLVPLVVSERSALAFYRALCARFSVDATGGDGDGQGWGPVEAWLPEGRLRWDRLLAAIDYRHLRLVAHENAALLATFACAPEAEGEDAVFAAFTEPATGASYRPTLPGTLIQPRSYSTVWTLTSPMAHGADEKTGNVTLFRRHRVKDALTGEHCYVPFVSGNAVRGLWRDMVMGRWLRLLGLSASDIPPARAHALLAGGAVDKGADTAAVNVDVRRRARQLCPPWDLLAGCTDQQIMAGRARVHDATLVCRETAWLVRPIVAPTLPLADFAASLPESSECTTLRLGTRHAHRDVAESDGSQMIYNSELLIPGSQMVHSFQIWGIDSVDPVTQGCLSDLLEDFRDVGTVGALASRGAGLIAFDRYQSGPGTPALAPATVYLGHVEQHRAEMIEWAMMRGEPAQRVKRSKAAGAHRGA
jgi:hypothetical protein